MKNKILILFIIFVLLSISVNAVKCGDQIEVKGVNETAYDYCSVDSGTSYHFYTISKCQGDVTVRVRTKLKNDNYYINELIKQDENMWVGKCRNNMPIILTTNSETENEFDIVLGYYEQIDNGMTQEQLDESIYKRTKPFSNIRVNYKENEPNIKIFTLDNLDSGLYFIFGFVIIIIIIIVSGVVYFWKKLSNDKENIILGENKKTLDPYDDIDKILENIK